MKKILVLLAVLTVALSGCATSGDYTAYVAAQSEANRIATDTQKPLIRLTAQPGQQITGLASLEVYMPTTAPVIQQARPNEWVGLLGQGVSVAGAAMGLKFSGDAAAKLADAVGKYSTAGYSSIQAPAASISTITTTDASNRSTATTTDASNRSTTTGAVSNVGDNSGSNSANSGRLAGTSISDATSTPTVVTVTQPAPVIVTQPAPVIVTPSAPVIPAQ